MLGGPLLWVDDAAFSITRHLHVARVSAPWGRGCDAGQTTDILRSVPDRSRPLWEVWFMTEIEGRC
jgi:diacylglycerol O-acyltransferase